MRTTLNIDEHALAKAKKLATQRNVSLGTVVSDIILEAFRSGSGTAMRNGVPVYTQEPYGIGKTGKSDLETVNRLRDDLDDLSS